MRILKNIFNKQTLLNAINTSYMSLRLYGWTCLVTVGIMIFVCDEVYTAKGFLLFTLAYTLLVLMCKGIVYFFIEKKNRKQHEQHPLNASVDRKTVFRHSPTHDQGGNELVKLNIFNLKIEN